MYRRDALKCMCCSPLLGLIKPAQAETRKRIETIMLVSMVSQYAGLPVHVVITDSIDPVENGVRMTNRAWHVFDKRTFVGSLIYHPEYKQNIVWGNLPAKVQEFLKSHPDAFDKWKQFHMFQSRWEAA